MKPEDVKIICIGPQVWGKGDTLNEAIQKMNKANNGKVKNFVAYVVHPDTKVADAGGFIFPEGYRPKKIYQFPNPILKFNRISDGEYKSTDGRVIIFKTISKQTYRADEICWGIVIDGKNDGMYYDSKKEAIRIAERLWKK